MDLKAGPSARYDKYGGRFIETGVVFIDRALLF